MDLVEVAHYEPPHQDLHCLQIQLFSSLVVKELKGLLQTVMTKIIHYRINHSVWDTVVTSKAEFLKTKIQYTTTTTDTEQAASKIWTVLVFILYRDLFDLCA